MARTAHAPLRPQLVQQLFFQHSAGLNKQAAVVEGGSEEEHALQQAQKLLSFLKSERLPPEKA
jgi:hypothetical protein